LKHRAQEISTTKAKAKKMILFKFSAFSPIKIIYLII